MFQPSVISAVVVGRTCVGIIRNATCDGERRYKRASVSLRPGTRALPERLGSRLLTGPRRCGRKRVGSWWAVARAAASEAEARTGVVESEGASTLLRNEVVGQPDVAVVQQDLRHVSAHLAH